MSININPGDIIGGIGKLAADIRSAITGEVSPELKMKLVELEYQAQSLQVQLNVEEAKSVSLFKSGWRPAVGWICVIGFAYIVLIQPLCAWVSLIFGIPLPPKIDASLFLPVLLGMLGLATTRTIEKLNGITK